MANKITYQDKVATKPAGVAINQVQDVDMNEIKTKHNLNDDRVTQNEADISSNNVRLTDLGYISDVEKMDSVIFKKSSVIDTDNKVAFAKLLKRISLIAPYGMNDFYINDVYSNYVDNANLYQIRLFGSYDGTTFERVAQYSVTESKDISEFEEISFSEYENSGVSGSATVDWSEMNGYKLNEFDDSVDYNTFKLSYNVIDNYFSDGNTLFKRDGYVDNSGSFIDSSEWRSTGLISRSEVLGGTSRMNGGATSSSVAYYDEDGIWISSEIIGAVTDIINLYESKFPENTEYVSFSARYTEIDDSGVWVDGDNSDNITAKDKFIHFSFDDTVALFEDLTDNSAVYESIFENETLAWCRYMHVRYGAKFSLFIYMKTLDETWQMTSCTTAFADEFAENIDWLKAGLHLGTLLTGSNYASATTGQAATDYAEFVTVLTSVMGSSYAIDRMPRLHNFAATEEAAQEMRDADIGVLGFLGADDVRDSYYLTTAQSSLLFTRDLFKEDINQLIFTPTDIRLERDDSDAIFTAIESGTTWNKKSNILVIFTHEYELNDTIKSEMEQCAVSGIELGYKFGYIQEIIK